MTLWIYDGLIECADFNDGQQLFYQVPSLQDLFKTDKADVILDLLKLKAAAQYRLLWSFYELVIAWSINMFSLWRWP